MPRRHDPRTSREIVRSPTELSQALREARRDLPSASVPPPPLVIVDCFRPRPQSQIDPRAQSSLSQVAAHLAPPNSPRACSDAAPATISSHERFSSLFREDFDTSTTSSSPRTSVVSAAPTLGALNENVGRAEHVQAVPRRYPQHIRASLVASVHVDEEGYLPSVPSSRSPLPLDHLSPPPPPCIAHSRSDSMYMPPTDEQQPASLRRRNAVKHHLRTTSLTTPPSAVSLTASPLIVRPASAFGRRPQNDRVQREDSLSDWIIV